MNEKRIHNLYEAATEIELKFLDLFHKEVTYLDKLTAADNSQAFALEA